MSISQQTEGGSVGNMQNISCMRKKLQDKIIFFIFFCLNFPLIKLRNTQLLKASSKKLVQDHRFILKPALNSVLKLTFQINVKISLTISKKKK
jgi:hypothetical protein